MGKPLDGQTILVTGATGGLGAAIVEQVAAAGARPILHYNSDKSNAEALLKRINGKGVVLRCGLSAPDGAFELWRRAVEAEGRIHGLVNNAGIRTEITVDASPDEWRLAWLKEFQVNVFAAADLCREAIKHFKEHGGGRIVNMSSRAGQRGYAANAMPYGASKAALSNITKSIARSFGNDGITAVNICPGWVATDMAEDFVAKHGKAAAVADIPIGEMASPFEVAELVAFVLRPSQASLNGATLDVNGGSYIR
ncbi:3-ketoacyl-ACP reductase [Caballeronia arvi]|uniref:3-ketoacyl-ACP reductase n=1 Tax=Caballeronia arvi TaxID=1777135 RepID=A0A158KIX6_9BURK|nr:SDR family oxidoreductase [Caballeronia arvi]SAL81096.1 3-ketoacyl-ACP reductase [Caballeronia arvi]